MTDHVVRLYAATGAVLVFCLSWVTVAAKPWATGAAAPDPRIAALDARQQHLQRESVAVRRLVARRWAAYRANQRTRAAARPPDVRVVTLPPLTVTRTS